MKKQLLSLSDLYNFFCLQEKDFKFSAIDDNASIVVHVEEPLMFESDDENDEQLKVNLRLCHTLKNLNQSFISEEVMEEAIPSAYNMPILGYIWEDENGVAKFAGHEFYIDDDSEIVYEEIPIGLIPESADLKLVESDDDRKYLQGQGIIWRNYTKAAEILEREKNLSVSVELNVKSLSFDGKNKVLNIKSFEFEGVTILQESRDGSGKEINPGMQGACISIDSLEDFSKKENSMFSKEIVQKLDELKEKLDNLSNFEINTNLLEKGGEKDLKKEFETEDATSTAEEATQVTEEEAADATAGEETTDEPKTEETEQFEENNEESTEEGAEEGANDTSEEGEEEGGEDAGVEAQFSKTFELSHSDVKVGLYALLAPFEEADNEWYGIVDVFDGYFIYQGMFDASNCFKQEYKKEGDQISFTSDRIHLNAEYLTDNELAELNAMRSNYSEISEKLAKYEAEPQKVEKIQSEEYSMIRDTEEYQKVAADHFDLSVEEISKTLDDIVLKYAKSGKVFSKTENNKPTVERKLFAVDANGKRSGKYDSLFKK